MRMRILAEGSTKRQRSMKHWGLSVLIDDDILFDTFGKPGYVAKRLQGRSFNIGRIRHIVISHDDWDHITGLWKILDLNKSATVYLCPHFHPGVKARLARRGIRTVEPAGPLRIRGEAYLSGELAGGERDGIALPEQYLAIKAPKGLVVITGCAHPGIVEIVRHAKRNFGSSVRLLIGGFHLKDTASDINAGIVQELRELGVRQVMPLHCTGKDAVKIFCKVYGADCIMASEGEDIAI